MINDKSLPAFILRLSPDNLYMFRAKKEEKNYKSIDAHNLSLDTFTVSVCLIQYIVVIYGIWQTPFISIYE